MIALTFVTALYVDCSRAAAGAAWGPADYTQLLTRSPYSNPHLDTRAFVASLRQATLMLVPVCPFVSVIISFFFFIAISLLEFVSIDPQVSVW